MRKSVFACAILLISTAVLAQKSAYNADEYSGSDMASSESVNPPDVSPIKSVKNTPNNDARNAAAMGDGATATMDNTIILGGSTHDDRVSVGIGTNYPTSLASLELSGSDRGFLINRMTESEIGMFEMSLGVMEEGMMVYNIDRARLQTWTGTKWVSNNAADLSMNDHELSIDGGKKIDMRPYLDNKDEQSMKSATLEGNVLTIAIENGDPVSVDLTPVLQEYDERIEKLEALLMKSMAAQNSEVVSKRAILFQSNPNPAISTTTIRYQIPSDVQHANMVVTNSLGEIVVKTELNERDADGSFELPTSQLSSGVYYYTLYLDQEKYDTKKMIVE